MRPCTHFWTWCVTRNFVRKYYMDEARNCGMRYRLQRIEQKSISHSNFLYLDFCGFQQWMIVSLQKLLWDLRNGNPKPHLHILATIGRFKVAGACHRLGQCQRNSSSSSIASLNVTTNIFLWDMNETSQVKNNNENSNFLHFALFWHRTNAWPGAETAYSSRRGRKDETGDDSFDDVQKWLGGQGLSSTHPHNATCTPTERESGQNFCQTLIFACYTSLGWWTVNESFSCHRTNWQEWLACRQDHLRGNL